MQLYKQTAEEVLKALSSNTRGLSTEEAEWRQKEHGPNKLAAPKGKSLIARFFDQLKDPMIIILLVAALISGILAVVQNDSFADVIIILSVVLINAVLGVYQESKAEKAIEALQKMAASTVKVMRDHRVEIIPSSELVEGDVVLLEAGDAIPADGRLMVAESLQIEEAALTGESVPVTKQVEPLEGDKDAAVPLGDRKNMVYMGSNSVYGRGTFVVTAIGMDTEMGKIADALNKAEDGQTPLQIKLAQLSKILTWLVLGICVIVFGVQLLRAGEINLNVGLDSMMIAISLAVAAIPEGLAAVVTVVLSIGVTNMSKRNAIIRKLTAVETLGCAQIICSDKTGTLTQNRMTVMESFGDEAVNLANAMALCSDAEMDNDDKVVGEPTEAALVTWAGKLGNHKRDLKLKAPRIGEAPFDSLRKMMSTVHETDAHIVQYTKGASDVIVNLCTSYVLNGQIHPMDDDMRAAIAKANKTMADKALRVLAVACRSWDQKPSDFAPAALEQDLCFMGLCGMIDPIRPEVKAAITECLSAGIRPVMITGDHVDTATAIAKELGILMPGRKAITGAELDTISDEAFESEVENISVYARVQPEHKTRIVSAWQKKGYVTAMTGDGVNDAPSIKTADIGVGMGITGTDVTKNVADMVLADDNFATIVNAVEEGRRIYDNIRKCIQFLLSSNMSEVLSIFSATLMGFTLFKPVHLLWINLITDCFPALALGTEQAEPGIMNRDPRSSKAGIFANGMGLDIFLQGVLVTALVIFSYLIGVKNETGSWQLVNSATGTTMAFITMNMVEVFHSINMRSQRGSIFRLRSANWLLIGSAVGAILLTFLVTNIPFLENAFGLVELTVRDWAVAFGLGISIIPLVEIIKLIQRKIHK